MKEAKFNVILEGITAVQVGVPVCIPLCWSFWYEYGLAISRK